jgi:hypothetical protein
MGAPGRRYQARELLINIHPALQCSISEARLKIQSCHRQRRPPRSAEGDAPADQHAADGPARDFAGGAGATDARELLIVAILQFSAVSRGGHDFQADFYEAR